MRVPRRLAERPGLRAWLLGAALALATLASRLPFVARTTAADHDAAHFALALDHFDLLHKQPHPPGYLLFLAPAALLHEAGIGPLAALISVSILFSVVGVVATWRLARVLFGPAAALAAAALLLSSPLYWSRGELGLSYTAEAACQAVLGLAFWSAMSSSSCALLWGGLSLGLLAGIREDLLLFVGPLALWVARRYRPAMVLGAVALLIAAALLWVVPLLMLSGGPEGYFYATRIQAGSMFEQTGPESAANLRTNARVVAMGLGWLGGAGWLILLPWVFATRTRLAQAWTDSRSIFLAVWTVPPVLFFLVIFAKLDYLLAVAPAVMAVLGGALVRQVPDTTRRGVTLGVLVAANSALFLVWPASNDEPLGRRDIVAGDALVNTYRTEVAEHYTPRDAVVIVPADSALDFRTAMLEIPSYAVYGIDFEQLTTPTYILARAHTSSYPLPSGGAVLAVDETTTALVWLSDQPPPADHEIRAEARATEEGVRYFVVPFQTDQSSLQLGQFQLLRSSG